jgi:16S rRNA (cytosine967-C5)-methyltransferase
MTDVTGAPPRLAALKLLDAVVRRGLPLEAALTSATQGIANPADRALARAIAAETLRWLTDIDALIDGATRNRLADDAKARAVIRLALAQVLVLGTPEHAAVSTALPLVDGGPRRLVHGVLGTILRQGRKLPALPTLPDPVLARWHGVWGDAMIKAAQIALSAPPPVDLTLKNPADTALWVERLGGTSLMPGHVRLNRGTAIHELAGYDEGAWWVQNIAASLPARMLGPGEGRAVLDLCAAPGGKTMQLISAGWDVTALDSDRARLVRLGDNLTRTGLSAKVVQADVLSWTPPSPVAAVLLDAPCSSTGIFARHPDVLYRVRPKDIAAMAAVQSAMISRVAPWLEPGGTFIFATCSLEPQEGEAHIATALAAGLQLNPIATEELAPGIEAHPDGWVRVLPAGHADGFFIARFTRA